MRESGDEGISVAHLRLCLDCAASHFPGRYFSHLGLVSLMTHEWDDLPLPRKYLGEQVKDYIANQTLAPAPLQKFNIEVKSDGEKIEVEEVTTLRPEIVFFLVLWGLVIWAWIAIKIYRWWGKP